jgi:hypothetical protein
LELVEIAQRLGVQPQEKELIGAACHRTAAELEDAYAKAPGHTMARRVVTLARTHLLHQLAIAFAELQRGTTPELRLVTVLDYHLTRFDAEADEAVSLHAQFNGGMTSGNQ